jgi:hypothetical protein
MFEYKIFNNIIEENHTYEIPNEKYYLLDMMVFSDRIL